MRELTPEEREANKRRWYEESVRRWNKSFCSTCPLTTERAKQGYLQLGAFRCDDPMGEIHMLSRTYPAETIEDCSIVNNIYDLYNVQMPRVDKVKVVIEQNPKLLDMSNQIGEYNEQK